MIKIIILCVMLFVGVGWSIYTALPSNPVTQASQMLKIQMQMLDQLQEQTVVLREMQQMALSEESH